MYALTFRASGGMQQQNLDVHHWYQQPVRLQNLKNHMGRGSSTLEKCLCLFLKTLLSGGFKKPWTSS